MHWLADACSHSLIGKLLPCTVWLVSDNMYWLVNHYSNYALVGQLVITCIGWPTVTMHWLANWW